jgi:hypothetical protein
MEFLKTDENEYIYTEIDEEWLDGPAQIALIQMTTMNVFAIMDGRGGFMTTEQTGHTQETLNTAVFGNRNIELEKSLPSRSLTIYFEHMNIIVHTHPLAPSFQLFCYYDKSITVTDMYGDVYTYGQYIKYIPENKSNILVYHYYNKLMNCGTKLSFYDDYLKYEIEKSDGDFTSISNVKEYLVDDLNISVDIIETNIEYDSKMDVTIKITPDVYNYYCAKIQSILNEYACDIDTMTEFDSVKIMHIGSIKKSMKFFRDELFKKYNIKLFTY